MNTRHFGILGTAALALALTAPVQAATDLFDGVIIVAKRDRDDARETLRDDRKRDRRSSQATDPRDEDHDDAQGYGYGYERRHKQRSEEDGRPRGRR
ncbi:MAG: hypothetical protein ABL877_10715 [Thiobacillus sp.]